jgi:hypothetical protein
LQPKSEKNPNGEDALAVKLEELDELLRGVAAVRPTGWVLGDDGLLVELPADSDTITIGTLQNLFFKLDCIFVADN